MRAQGPSRQAESHEAFRVLPRSTRTEMQVLTSEATHPAELTQWQMLHLSRPADRCRHGLPGVAAPVAPRPGHPELPGGRENLLVKIGDFGCPGTCISTDYYRVSGCAREEARGPPSLGFPPSLLYLPGLRPRQRYCRLSGLHGRKVFTQCWGWKSSSRRQ